MSTAVATQEKVEWQLPPARPLDEGIWHAWIVKGRASDRRTSANTVRAVRWISIAGLLAAAGLWSLLTPYEVVVRFLVAAGALVMMVQTFRGRHYVSAALFAALVLLYNPLAPVFAFAGDWQRALVVVSTLPFLASLAWSKSKA